MPTSKGLSYWMKCLPRSMAADRGLERVRQGDDTRRGHHRRPPGATLSALFQESCCLFNVGGVGSQRVAGRAGA